MKTFAVISIMLMSLIGMAQPSMTPPEELKKLDWMLGEWSGTMKWTMEGESADVETTMKTEIEGQFVKTVSTMTMGPMKMTETQYLGWDKVAKKFVAWAFTNFSPSPRVEKGGFEGDKFVLISEPWDVSGTSYISRGTMSKKNDKEALFILEFKKGDKWEKVGEAILKKKS